MRTGTGIFLFTAGAILLFALRSGSPHWLNLQIVGMILILAGGLGLLLPRLARSQRDGDWLRRRVRAGQSEDLGVPFITADQGGDDLPAQAPDTEAPTLADDLLNYEPHRRAEHPDGQGRNGHRQLSGGPDRGRTLTVTAVSGARTCEF